MAEQLSPPPYGHDDPDPVSIGKRGQPEEQGELEHDAEPPSDNKIPDGVKRVRIPVRLEVDHLMEHKYQDDAPVNNIFKDGPKKEPVYGYQDPSLVNAEQEQPHNIKKSPLEDSALPVKPQKPAQKNVTLLESLDQHGNVASRELVGTPYCRVCKNYLGKILNVNWKDPQSGIITGFLKKKGSMHIVRKARWFILAEGHLVYYILPEDFGTTFPNGVVHLDGSIVHDKDLHGTEFTIESGRRKKMNLKAENVNEKRKWIAAIRASDEKHTKTTESHQVSDLGHFCVECNKYLNMDYFTLAEMDGFLSKWQKKKNSFAKKWTVYSKGHIAYFDDLHDVSLYQPHKIIHVEQGGVSKVSEKEFTFSVKSLEREFLFKADNLELYKDWLDALGVKS